MNIFYRPIDNGNARILYTIDGEPVTCLPDETTVYPIDSAFSVAYNHPEGLTIAIADAVRIGIPPESVAADTSKIYAVCGACGEVVYREPGKYHGDGQQDSDENPVWLLSGRSSLWFHYRDDLEGRDVTKLPRVNCGCTEHS
jgi:hypothetical protein